jgi:hypothetical protein
MLSANILSEFIFPQEYSEINEIIIAYKEILKNNKPTKENNSKVSIIAKILSLADYFVSLISTKAPLEKNKKLSEVLKIMQQIKNEEKIDPVLYDIFIKNDIYMDFAKEYLNNEQIDEINIEEII